MTPAPDDRMRKAAAFADKIRRAVVRLLDEDAAAAAQIRKGSDRILAVADETHKHPLPTRSLRLRLNDYADILKVPGQ